MAERFLFVVQNGGLCRAVDSSSQYALASIRLNDGVIAALQRFSSSGYAIVLLADPAPNDGDKITIKIADKFVAELLESQAVAATAMLRCKHAPDAGCDCALPGIGLVDEYIAYPALDREASIVIGADGAAHGLARAMGLRGFVVSADSGWEDIAHQVLDRPRRASVSRRTKETNITVEVDLDRIKDPEVDTGLGFFDHMLEQLGKHGGFALSVQCSGDLEVDEHHTVEDVALTLGQALREALGDKRGIGRYGFLLPMDEAEAQVAIDLSGRAYSVFEGDFPRDSVGGLPTELVGHFFRSLADTLGAAIHVSVRGENAHHMVEGCFKGVARALRQALARSGQDLPSTKGAL